MCRPPERSILSKGAGRNQIIRPAANDVGGKNRTRLDTRKCYHDCHDTWSHRCQPSRRSPALAGAEALAHMTAPPRQRRPAPRTVASRTPPAPASAEALTSMTDPPPRCHIEALALKHWGLHIVAATRSWVQFKWKYIHFQLDTPRRQTMTSLDR